MSNHCSHCNLPLGKTNFPLDESPDAPRFCCPACRLVYVHIQDHGLNEYYKRRTVLPGQPDQETPDYSCFDDKDYLRDHYLDESNEDIYTGRFWLDGLHCSACAWLIETRLQQIQGVVSANVSFSHRSLAVKWKQHQVKLSEILTTLFELGYQGVEWSPELKQQRTLDEKKYIQQRMGVAGLLMMQVGMLSLGLYAGEWQGMASGIQQLMRVASAGLSALCIIYCAQPFIRSALFRLQQRTINVDVPISLALVLTWFGSVYATLIGHDNVYFDTVTMFVFFLLVSRFIEASSRVTDLNHTALTIPATSDLFINLDRTATKRVPTISLKPGDHILCRAGETLPSDGIVVSGNSGVNESLFSGESDLQSRSPGDAVFAASINVEHPLCVQVTATGKDCALHQLESLAHSLEIQKPDYAKLIDRLSPWFVYAVFGIALLTSGYWMMTDSSQVFTASIAVLVAACPCALSLSTPTAYATTNARLRRQGVAIRNASLLETLASINHVVFDKTGTLSTDSMALKNISLIANGETGPVNRESALQIAASLEQHTSHPIANAVSTGNELPLLSTEFITNRVGKGVEGVVEGTLYRIGVGSWASEIIRDGKKIDSPYEQDILLVAETGQIARFDFCEVLRDGAVDLITTLKQRGLAISILSGDSHARVAAMASRLGVESFQSQQSPSDKLAAIQQMRDTGDCVLMIGDGLNDIPVLAAADASVAVASASTLSKNHADAILLGNNLNTLNTLLIAATNNRKIIRQNICWAIGYNTLVMPLAAMAFLPPWLAALGMSLSSIIVVLNSRQTLRKWRFKLLTKRKEPATLDAVTPLAYRG